MSETNQKNSLMMDTWLPQFDQVKYAEMEPAIHQILEENRGEIKKLLERKHSVSWENFIQPTEELEDRLNKAFSVVSHLNNVSHTPEIRDIYNDLVGKITEYQTELGQNPDLFSAYKTLASTAVDEGMDESQQQLLENAIRDFRLAGVELPEIQRNEYAALEKKLVALSSEYSNNLMDATQAWSKHITEKERLAGLPETLLEQAAELAQQKDLSGYLLNLQMPSYIAVMTYADNAELREEIYHAYATRASDQGPNANEFDNTSLMHAILDCRKKMAQLLGFDSYASLSLATKMADEPKQVIDFLQHLAQTSLPKAREEFAELEAFAKKELGLEKLQPWDLTYVGEKLKQSVYDVSQEELRAYFPTQKVLEGMFQVVERLFGVTCREDLKVVTYHPHVVFYGLYRGDEQIGGLYMDLYAREDKRGGAWMDECRVRRKKAQGELQLPIAHLVCNAPPATAQTPSLLTHNDVTTLFHEFGHCLHHLCTTIEWAAVSGINGVAWDAVELPSQFLENWCWQKASLVLISGHFETGEPLPDAMLDKLLKLKHFQAGMQMVRQLEFALFDIRLHMEYSNTLNIQQLIDEVRERVAVIKVPEYHRFQNGFAHIFSGGYGAGYYSYKWAEVLAADTFSRFLAAGIFDQQVGVEFLEKILSRGGSKPAKQLFMDFMGREPNIEALLVQSGILRSNKTLTD